MPPEWMWLLDEDLIDHFEKVRGDREDRYGTSSRDKDDDSGLMMQNEYAKGRGRSASR